ncbi:MAG: Xaa-Pro peptidase family protein [Actinomycetota bacterium]|nr:Xaa-Pro peptidase family protein [Actinomycetota bacterium]
MTAKTEPLYPADRLIRAQQSTGAAGLDGLLVTPGADLRYLTGYDALPLERLTCLVLPRSGPPALVVPELEAPRAAASPAGALGIEIVSWPETADPFGLATALLRDALGMRTALTAVGVADRMWAVQALRFADRLAGVRLSPAGTVLAPLRIRKTLAEIEALRRAGQAIDRVHERFAGWRVSGRSEADVGRDIAAAIVEEGHATVNFVIVASGPNGASPHHDTGDRLIGEGDQVVVDIGGTTPEGYCSDSTRTYSVGEPPADFAASYAVLQAAQDAACAAVRPGIPAEAVDAVARGLIEQAGYGAYFVHRTGHGIGLEEHEDPYLVAGNAAPLEPGMAFSIEPGIYLPGRHGARIEDICVCTEEGGERLNLVGRDLVVLAG